jgi:hypothetical protein
MVIADRTIRAAIVKPTIRAAIVNFVCVIAKLLSTPDRAGLSLATRLTPADSFGTVWR